MDLASEDTRLTGPVRQLIQLITSMPTVVGDEVHEGNPESVNAAVRHAVCDALLVIAFQLSGRNIAHLIPEARQWPQPRPLTLTLRGRPDLALRRAARRSPCRASAAASAHWPPR